MVSINKIKLPVNDELFFPASLSITAIRQIAFMCLYQSQPRSMSGKGHNVFVRFGGFQIKVLCFNTDFF